MLFKEIGHFVVYIDALRPVGIKDVENVGQMLALDPAHSAIKVRDVIFLQQAGHCVGLTLNEILRTADKVYGRDVCAAEQITH